MEGGSLPVRQVQEAGWLGQGNSSEEEVAPGLVSTACKMTAADPWLKAEGKNGKVTSHKSCLVSL